MVGDGVVTFKPSGLQFHSHSFYEVERGTEWRMSESGRDRWRGERRYFRTPDNVNYVQADPNTHVRTISAGGQTTTRIAGIERTQNIFCRYEGWPLAVTNHDVFLPAIERELESWVERVIKPLMYERVVEVELGHVGDFVHRDQYGTIEIRFDAKETRENWNSKVSRFGGFQSQHDDVVRARMRFYGDDVGVVGRYNLGRAFGPAYGRQPYLAQWQRLEDKLKRGRFTLDRLNSAKDGTVHFDCSRSTGKCVLEVQRWYLDRVRH